MVDWDDTLFPTTALMRAAASAGVELQKYHPSLGELRELREISHHAIALMAHLHHHCQVAIMTNSSPGWCMLTARLFMPSLAKFIETRNIIIVSAPEVYYLEQGLTMLDFPSEISSKLGLAWKAAALRQLLALNETKELPDLLSIGDGEAEEWASYTMLSEGRVREVRLVKLSQKATYGRLSRELKATLDFSITAVIPNSGHCEIDLGAFRKDTTF